jgi:hypothetical protein
MCIEALKHYIVNTTIILGKTHENARSSHATKKIQHVRRQAAPKAPRDETRRRLLPMARLRNAVVGEGILAEEEAASTPSEAADNPRKTLSACAILWTARETLQRHEANNWPTCIPL